jgi:predicted metalloendopeptidase
MSIAASPVAEALGELYVARTFSPQAQQRALQLVADIRAAMRARIERLDWMSAATKERALAKLDAIVPKIGAPAQWRRWEGLEFRRDDFAGNALRAAEWQTRERLAELDKPVDRRRWNTSAHVVNAFAGALNDIVFPAGILQPPFFDAGADDATNYGAIGAVIGHEITHHFDDRGRQFDADGNLADWWSAADAAAYRERADRVAALYAGYEPAPGLRIDGRLTLGENISDLSGVQIAWDGLQIALARDPDATPAGTAAAARRFFVANATLWRSKQRAEAVVTQLRTDSHAPARWRVLGPLSNMPAFARSFGCKAGAPMAAIDPITLW